MARTPTAAQTRFVNQRTRALVRAQRPFMAQFVGYVAPPPAPVNTTLPVASGTGTVGATLSVTDGLWSNNPTSFAYQWLRDGNPVVTATASTRVLTALDSGTNVSCRVTATNAGGSTPAISNAIAVA